MNDNLTVLSWRAGESLPPLLLILFKFCAAPRGERVRILYDSKHAARVALGVAHAGNNIALACRCNDSFSSVRTSFTLPFTMLLAMLATPGMNVLIVLFLA